MGNDSNQGSQGDDKPTVPDHKLVTLLNAGGAPPPGYVILSGYLQNLPKKGAARIYLSLDLRDYYELPVEAIGGRAWPANKEDEDGPWNFAVAADTKLDLVRTGIEASGVAFLRGAITSGYLPGSYESSDRSLFRGTIEECYSYRVGPCNQSHLYPSECGPCNH